MNFQPVENQKHTIGIFDSGVGGLSVLKAILEIMPAEDMVYLADQAHVPYGSRPLTEVRAFSEGITRFLLTQGADVIVVACNTASAAALLHLRSVFAGIPFVGMEPAIKPAAEQTHTGVVGVLATPATFQGELYASVVERFGKNVKLLQSTCPGLVREIEKGDLEGSKTRQILREAIEPMLEQKIDTIVLGCTHYPFVIPVIQEIAGEAVRVIDPAPAVARQTARLLGIKEQPRSFPDPAARVMFTSGDGQVFKDQIKRLIGHSWEIRSALWDEKEIQLGERAF